MDDFYLSLYGIPSDSPSLDSIEPSLASPSPSLSPPFSAPSPSLPSLSLDGRATHSIPSTGETRRNECIDWKEDPRNEEGKCCRKRKSPNTDKSMYATFFRARQSAIRVEHPCASFGEISRLIAAEWDKVDQQEKLRLKLASTEAKREEMRRRISLRTIQLCTEREKKGQHITLA